MSEDARQLIWGEFCLAQSRTKRSGRQGAIAVYKALRQVGLSQGGVDSGGFFHMRKFEAGAKKGLQ
jgi:hypothetical protein